MSRYIGIVLASHYIVSKGVKEVTPVEEGKLKGRVALVTGAGAGIGRDIAGLFAREGARIGINYFHNEAGARETLHLIRQAGSEGILLKADVSRTDLVKKMVDQVVEHFGTLDILVNNSGIGTSESPDRVLEITENDWDRVLDVNLKGVMLSSKHALKIMINKKSGSIINISSIRGLLGNPGLASYCASKAGVVLLSRQMAVEYASYGIRVNCICPGFIYTEMFASYIERQEEPDKARKIFKSMSPMNRIGKPEEIAKVALFFASDASSFITGAVLPVDGGYTAYGMRRIM